MPRIRGRSVLSPARFSIPRLSARNDAQLENQFMRAPAIFAIIAGILATPAPKTAREIVLASAEAIGGVERLRAVRAVRVEEVGGEYLVSTITRRDAPPRLIAQTDRHGSIGRDSVLRRTVAQILPMRAWLGSARRRWSIEASRRQFAATATQQPAHSTSRPRTRSSRCRRSACCSPRSMRKDLRLERDTRLGGVPHHVVSLGVDGAPVRLFIDASSGFPTRVELVRAYPTNVFWAMWGDIRFVTTWSAWALERGGVWYPRQRSCRSTAMPFREFVVTALDLDSTARADSVAIPDSVRPAFATRAGAASGLLRRGGHRHA